MDTLAGAGYAASWTTAGTSGEKTVTEAEWSCDSDPDALLRLLKGRASKRKLRLFACACCRRHRGVVRGKNLRILDAAEDFADERIHRKEMAEMRRRWYTFDYPFPIRGTWQAALSCATMTQSMAWAVRETANHAALAKHWPERERLIQAAYLRDIFGNPFRPIAINPSWLAWQDALVACLAQAASEERHLPSGTLDNGRLAILADALEEAGCTDTDILGHLRGPGPHVRGCWPVDLVLGKS